MKYKSAITFIEHGKFCCNGQIVIPQFYQNWITTILALLQGYCLIQAGKNLCGKFSSLEHPFNLHHFTSISPYLGPRQLPEFWIWEVNYWTYLKTQYFGLSKCRLASLLMLINTIFWETYIDLIIFLSAFIKPGIYKRNSRPLTR